MLVEFGLWRSSKRGVQQSSICRAPAANQSNNPITMADSGDHAPTDIKAEAPQATTADQTAASTADDIEAAVDVDTEMQTDSSHTMDNSSNAKSAANATMDGTSDDAPAVPQIETRMPAKKDVALRDFLSKMDEYAPIVSSLSARSRPLSLTLLIRFPTQSQTTTSPSPACPHHQRPHLTWPDY